MKKLIVFSVLALLVFETVGCEKKEEEKKTPKEKYFDCETEKSIYKTLNNESVFVKYSEHYKVFVIMFNDPTQTAPRLLVPCGNSLPKEYQIEGLKVKVSGVCRNCTPIGTPNMRIAPLFKINISSIKKY